MNGRTLRSTAGWAGTFTAAAAGALTVGLISGVVHTAQAQSAITTTNSGSSTGSTSKSGTSTKNNGNSTSGIGGVSQNVQPVGGSNGS